MAPKDVDTASFVFCSHCERDVPTANFNLHSLHCKRNLERCSVCGEMVARTCADEHFNELHALVPCSKCGAGIERELLYIHENEKCPQRMVACVYCDFPVSAADLHAHSDHCGSRTEMCIPCGKYVRLREKIAHDLQFHGEISGNEDSTRECITGPGSLAYLEVPPQSAPSRTTPPSTSRHKLLFTFAITGFAIVIGTYVLQRRGPNQ
ncbi:unnamed protein product [Sphagnum balticum]